MLSDGFIQPVVGQPMRLQVWPTLYATRGRAGRELRKVKADALPAFQLTERDRDVLAGLHRYRVLTTVQIQSLYYHSYRQTCRRLRLLYLYNFAVRLLRPPTLAGKARTPAYRLGKRGAQLLADGHGLKLAQFAYWGRDADRDGHRMECSYAFVEHMLDLARFRTAIEQASRRAEVTVVTWRDEVEYRRQQLADSVQVTTNQSRTGKTVKILPDGYFVLETSRDQRGHFFVEVDRGTESIRNKWQTKVLGYKALLASGAFRKRYAVTNPATAFRVLVTAPSATRALHLKAAFERYGDGSLSQLLLVAPLPVVLGADSLAAPIWLRGGTTVAQGLLPASG